MCFWNWTTCNLLALLSRTEHLISTLSFPESAALGTWSSKESNKARRAQLAQAAEMPDWRRLMLVLEAEFHVMYLCLVRRQSLPPITLKNTPLKSPTSGSFQTKNFIQPRVQGQLERSRHRSEKTLEWRCYLYSPIWRPRHLEWTRNNHWRAKRTNEGRQARTCGLLCRRRWTASWLNSWSPEKLLGWCTRYYSIVDDNFTAR